jgi:exopolysaccharide biosynthesis polyprenyl glycosylphosphotransferase
MKRKDTADVLASLRAAGVDALAVFGGFMMAVWVRFDSGWLKESLVAEDRPADLYWIFTLGALAVTAVFLLVFKGLELYERPQTGRFENKIPRLMRAVVFAILITAVMAFAIRVPGYPVLTSRLTLAIAFFTIAFWVLLERYLLFRLELHEARHSTVRNAALLVGTDEVAARLARAIRHEPRLRTRVVGFLATNGETPHPELGAEPVLGRAEDLESILKEGGIDQLIICDTRLPQERVLEIILLCERNLVTFRMVPDLFRIMTGAVDVLTVGDVPLLGVSQWPLDFFWNRFFKRAEDVAGGLVGLLVSAPVIAVAALLIKRTSPGPVFYRQERCGEAGRTFTLYKLRTMAEDAEADGPGWTKEKDPRRTRVGATLRAYNLDELPQFWNVLKGDMSLVGPRPERPHFVEQFKEDIQHYMWRHVSKPGITGWAQVHGLRGNTSIEERIRYDLYYLEKWSLSLDFKILIKTLFARENAY